MSEFDRRYQEDFLNFKGVNFEVEPEVEAVADKTVKKIAKKPKPTRKSKLDKKVDEILKHNQELTDSHVVTHAVLNTFIGGPLLK